MGGSGVPSLSLFRGCSVRSVFEEETRVKEGKVKKESGTKKMRS